VTHNAKNVRKEDKEVINWISKIVKMHGIKNEKNSK